MVVLLALLVAFSLLAAGILYRVVGTERYGNTKPKRLQLTAREAVGSDQALRAEPCRTVRVYFIKPSRYDEEGYVQFFRYGVQPNNTLTVLKALNDTLNQQRGAERNVVLETVIWDEMCDGVVTPETIVAIKEKAIED